MLSILGSGGSLWAGTWFQGVCGQWIDMNAMMDDDDDDMNAMMMGMTSEIDAGGALRGSVADGRAEKDRGGLGFRDDRVWCKGECVVGLDSAKREHVFDLSRAGGVCSVCEVEKVELVCLELVEVCRDVVPRLGSDKGKGLEPVASDDAGVVDVAAHPVFLLAVGEEREVVVPVAGKLEEAGCRLEVGYPLRLGVDRTVAGVGRLHHPRPPHKIRSKRVCHPRTRRLVHPMRLGRVCKLPAPPRRPRQGRRPVCCGREEEESACYHPRREDEVWELLAGPRKKHVDHKKQEKWEHDSDCMRH